MADLKLTEIARRIDAHLKRFAADPKINAQRRPQRQPYFFPSASVAGGRLRVAYDCLHVARTLTRDEGAAYLAWLDAGGVGQHIDQQRDEAREGEDTRGSGEGGEP